MENYGPISNEYFATLQSEWQTAGTNLGTSLNTGASTSLTNGLSRAENQSADLS